LKICFILTYLPFILIPIILNFDNNNPTKEINIEAHQILKPVNDYNKKNIKQNIINIINNSESEYVIFGENNFPYLINQLDYLDISKNIKKNQKVIIGASTIKDNNFYNSFILLEKNKEQYFDKKILVPFGEFLPFRRFLKFMESISGTVDFKKGSNERILITKDNLKILPVICYEIIFDKILNNIDNHRIDILINITNDSWFGNRVGPYQHFYIARAKSLIANRPLIRVSNNGISAIINKNGKVIISTKLNQITSFKYKLILSEQSSFIRFHNYYIFYFILITLIFIIISKKKQNV
jgi:apolipoprotein N-acyltransferase